MDLDLDPFEDTLLVQRSPTARKFQPKVNVGNNKIKHSGVLTTDAALQINIEENASFMQRDGDCMPVYLPPDDLHCTYLDDLSTISEQVCPAETDIGDDSTAPEVAYVHQFDDENLADGLGTAHSDPYPSEPSYFSVVNEEENNSSPVNPASDIPTYRLIDEEEEEEEEDRGYEHFPVEDARDGRKDTSKKKKPSGQSTKKGEGRKRRKKPDESLENPSQVPVEKPRKFSHSTRRNRRHMNEELLKVPEEELDFQALPIKDVIFLGEYKEQLAKREAKSSKTTPISGQGYISITVKDGLTGEAETREKDGFLGSERGEDHEDDQRDDTDHSSFSLFNSRSFMEKTTRGKWSKVDTELFYQGIRQFGTDLSMIQQLFPGRTRRQLLLKMKSEERKYPFRINDALSSRTKDNSYFLKVIDQLRQATAKAGKEHAHGGDPDGEAAETEAAPENNGDVARGTRHDDVADPGGEDISSAVNDQADDSANQNQDGLPRYIENEDEQYYEYDEDAPVSYSYAYD